MRRAGDWRNTGSASATNDFTTEARRHRGHRSQRTDLDGVLAMNAAADDTAARRPVWYAMSDLFLDTELDDDVLQDMAKTLAASPYSIDELDKILFCEVYPVCIWN